ncbi:MAG TPA: PPC domain-containing DNA-binding protein [Spirochaetia bacterium]|nr:PPC domain-containing DNA-binding protein [Spirochaetia bacterium]
MRYFFGQALGRTIILQLERGEKLLESIRGLLERESIQNAIVLSAIGSLQRAHLHRVTGMQEPPVDEFIILERPMELASLQGLVIDGEPHFHMVISDRENTYSGHLEVDTTVLYLAEIALAELKGIELKRVKNELNIARIAEKT